jgi:maleylpyruvate isomerase
MAQDATRPEQALEWMRDGTARLLADVAALPDEALSDPSVLPGWDRRYLLSHIAANAEALRNLVHWARTGEERRMYASPEARDAGIRAGSAKPLAELRAWIADSAAALSSDLDALPGPSWDAKIITAQGLTREAREIPWMRVREVYVHGVDMGAGITFGDLPADFLAALLDDITARRSASGTSPALTLTAVGAGGSGSGVGGSGAGGSGAGGSGKVAGVGGAWEVAGAGERRAVTGPLADLAAWLSGRPVTGLTDTAGRPVPTLPPWL